jgi:excisionase family DNA binding protein
MDDIISTAEAARILGISQRAVNGLCQRGTLEAKQLGREWAVRRVSVLDYKAQKEAQEQQKEKEEK